MAVKLRQPVKHAIAAVAALLALAGLLAGPVHAAPERDLLCDDSVNPEVAIFPAELTATPVNNSDELLEGHILRPRTKAALRGAFSNDTAGDDSEIDALEAEADEDDTAEPRVQSTSKSKGPVYKRQMYRRDI